MAVNEVFRSFSQASAAALGAPWMFAANFLIILLWFISGPLFGFSDTWQLVVNTATTVFTYLAVFIIQNTQNRESKAIQLKLDELISSMDGARNRMVDLEGLPEAELDRLQKQFERLRRGASQGDIQAAAAIKGEPEEQAT